MADQGLRIEGVAVQNARVGAQNTSKHLRGALKHDRAVRKSTKGKRRPEC